MALFQKFGLTIGTWSVIVGLLLVCVTWFVKREYINIGTFGNALLVGPFMDLFLWLDFLPDASHTYIDYLLLACAIVIAGIAGGLYVAGGIGAGPRDGFMLAVSDRTKLSISRARIVVELVVLVIGYFLGGPVFVATFFFSLIQSPIFQVMLKFFRGVRSSLVKEAEEMKA